MTGLESSPFRADSERISELASGAGALVEKVKSVVTSPEHTKTLRQFSSAEAARFTGIPASSIKRKAREVDTFPSGVVNPKNGHRSFSMSDLLDMMDIEGTRPVTDEAFIAAFANFKGGSAKSTTSVHYAQFEALRGHRVLLVDLDPQGSMTSMFGLIPDTDVADSATARDFLAGHTESLPVSRTYWPNIDLIPANLSLYKAEFELPQRQQDNPESFLFFEALSEGLSQLSQDYDRIIIDTPPALSYLTTNALYAANGVIVPVQASMIDFTSCAQFLSLLESTTDVFGEMTGADKVWDVFRFVLTRFGGSEHERLVADWIHQVFGNAPIKSPLSTTSALQQVGPEMVTLYEADQRHPDPARRMNGQTYRRAMQIIDPVMEEIAYSVSQSERGGANPEREGAA